MNKSKFKKYLSKNIIILDGATGTELQKKGMPIGICPEKWVIDNPKALIELQKDYIKNGSNAVYTCTFGANRIKLADFSIDKDVAYINQKLAEISKEAVSDNGFVIGSLAPTGKFIRPLGNMSFEDIVDVYKEQAMGLLKGGVDFFVVETMMDLQEARAALIAVSEICDLPVMVSMTFDQNKRTLTGTDPTSAVITLQNLGASVVGCNCSTGPQDMLSVIKEMSLVANVPLLAKPNAGLPKFINGVTCFDMNENEFSQYIASFIQNGVCLIGGCCGTSPSYIKKIKENVYKLVPTPIRHTNYSAVSSSRKTVFIGNNEPLCIIGERINPTGKKQLQEELKNGNLSIVRQFATSQIESGANILDVNAGMPGIDEKDTMIKIIELLTQIVDAPICIDSSNCEVIESVLRIYPGRALINSISGETHKMDKLLKIAKRYGAMFILLPIDNSGVPKTKEERCSVIKKVYEAAKTFGFSKSDIVVDGIVMTISSEQEAALETLNVINWCHKEFGVSSIVGLSNISFGLPERSYINAAFLAMAITNGLSAAIANPSSELLMGIKFASDVLLKKDISGTNYIQKFSSFNKKDVNLISENTSNKITEKLYNCIVRGDKELVVNLIKVALEEGYKANNIVDEFLIPAIKHVGDLYERKEYFLPQLIQSAETMKNAFSYLEPMLESSNEQKGSAKIVLATVKGDIHDIGKNIVALMLKNYGYKVYDLGKDVSKREIIDKAKEIGAKIIGLSALMTTTMVEMKEVIELAKKENVDCKFIVGGAVVDEEYAKVIGADGYSCDAHGAVEVVKRLCDDK